jgi:hypothetical protein
VLAVVEHLALLALAVWAVFQIARTPLRLTLERIEEWNRVEHERAAAEREERRRQRAERRARA